MLNQPKDASQRRLQVFLCHSSGDKLAVHNLYQRLNDYNIDPWLDKEKLLPGQNWNLEIQEAVRKSDVVLICLSHNFIDKEGYVQKEITLALDTASEKPEGTIFLIPLKLEECELPQRLTPYQAVNYFDENGFDKLITALKHRAVSLKEKVEPIDCKLNSEDEDGLSAIIPDSFRENIRRNMPSRTGAVIVRVNNDQAGEEYHLIPDKARILQAGSKDWQKLISPNAIRSAIVRQYLNGIYAAVFEGLNPIDYLIWKGELRTNLNDPTRRRGITIHAGQIHEMVFD